MSFALGPGSRNSHAGKPVALVLLPWHQLDDGCCSNSPTESCQRGPPYMLACQLALRDVPFRIIDKNEDHTTQSRALVMQARSVEIFGQMDLAPEALQLGEKAKAVNVVVNGKRAFHM